jgi:myb proto-oncogene protein
MAFLIHYHQMQKAKSSKKIPRSRFSSAEDARLRELVRLYGTRQWDMVAQAMLGRKKRHCRERWFHYLAPDISSSLWTRGEDRRLLALIEEHGSRWTFLESFFPGRKDNALKNRHKLLLRRKMRGESPFDITSTPLESYLSTDAGIEFLESDSWDGCDGQAQGNELL